MDKFEIMLASGPDRDGLTAELWYADALVIEVYEDDGDLRLQMHGRPDNAPWEFRYVELHEALTALRGKLRQ